MAHKTLIGGTSYEISGGKTLVGGTAYSISGGKTLVGGTSYKIGFGTPIGELAVGSSVYMKVNGVSTEFILVHHGLPSATLYDSSCDGTWLLTKNIYELRAFDSTNNDYANSDIHAYLNGTFLGLFDSNIRSSIKQVKIPYQKGTGSGGSIASGSSGLSAKIILLSGYEIGWTTSTNAYFPIDGACLTYFKGASDADRSCTYNGGYQAWRLRSAYTNSTGGSWNVSGSGTSLNASVKNSYGIRPALILPSSVSIDENFNVIP